MIFVQTRGRHQKFNLSGVSLLGLSWFPKSEDEEEEGGGPSPLLNRRTLFHSSRMPFKRWGAGMHTKTGHALVRHFLLRQQTCAAVISSPYVHADIIPSCRLSRPVISRRRFLCDAATLGLFRRLRVPIVLQKLRTWKLAKDHHSATATTTAPSFADADAAGQSQSVRRLLAGRPHLLHLLAQ